MSTYRLTFDIEIPNDIIEDDKEEFESWLDHFKECVDDEIRVCHPLNDCDIDVNSNWEEI